MKIVYFVNIYIYLFLHIYIYIYVKMTVRNKEICHLAFYPELEKLKSQERCDIIYMKVSYYLYLRILRLIYIHVRY
jgi:hypothetical protein